MAPVPFNGVLGGVFIFVPGVLGADRSGRMLFFRTTDPALDAAAVADDDVVVVAASPVACPDGSSDGAIAATTDGFLDRTVGVFPSLPPFPSFSPSLTTPASPPMDPLTDGGPDEDLEADLD